MNAGQARHDHARQRDRSRHRGRIWLRATVEAPVAVATAPLPAVRESHDRLRVLLIDDEALCGVRSRGC